MEKSFLETQLHSRQRLTATDFWRSGNSIILPTAATAMAQSIRATLFFLLYGSGKTQITTASQSHPSCTRCRNLVWQLWT